MEIEIRNVDQQAYLDIRYIIDRYLMSVEGMKDTGVGSGTLTSNGVESIRERFEIIRNN